MAKIKTRQERRRLRRSRIRKKVSGTEQRPRVSLFRSNKHIYVQIIDDRNGRTLGGVSTLTKEFRDAGTKPGTVEAAQVVGKLLAEKAKSLNIDTIVFDRGGFRYHGAVKALADAAREGGLNF